MKIEYLKNSPLVTIEGAIIVTNSGHYYVSTTGDHFVLTSLSTNVVHGIDAELTDLDEIIDMIKNDWNEVFLEMISPNRIKLVIE